MAFDINANACKLSIKGVNNQTINFVELTGSGDFTTGDSKTTRNYIVEWSKALDLAQALVGFIQTNVNSQTWVTPHKDPERPYLFAQNVNATGVGAPGNAGLGGAISYDFAKLEVDYMLMPEGGQTPGSGGANSITFLTERYNPAAQAITLPKKKWKWKTGSLQGQAVGDDASLFVVVPQQNITIDIHWWFFAPNQIALAKNGGKVNNATFSILGTSYPKGTLRFDGTSRARQWTTTGIEAWQVTHSLMWQEEEWNKKFNPEDDEFQLVVTDSGRKIHKEVPFSPLFPI